MRMRALLFNTHALKLLQYLTTIALNNFVGVISRALTYIWKCILNVFEKMSNKRFKTSCWYCYVGHMSFIYSILILIFYLLETEAFFAHHFWPTTYNDAANETEMLS